MSCLLHARPKHHPLRLAEARWFSFSPSRLDEVVLLSVLVLEFKPFGSTFLKSHLHTANYFSININSMQTDLEIENPFSLKTMQSAVSALVM